MARPHTILLGVLILGLAGCHRAPTPGPEAGAGPQDQGPLSRVPLGNPPGEPVTAASGISNPFEGNAAAAQDGKALFSAMNCVYCHGANGSGLMGPTLETKGAWRYGGTPAQIYNSIHDGRPQGMPAWGGRLPPQDIWKLVAYIETLGGAEAPADPKMAGLLGPNPSTTGPEPADQSQTDAAAQAAALNNAPTAK